MINLLPTELKEEIVYGRRNRILSRWVVSVFIVIAAVAAMTVFGQLYINKNVRSFRDDAKVTQ